MRLTTKLTLALAIVLVLQFALYGYLVAKRLRNFFEQDIKQDSIQIGMALASSASRMWQTHGPKEAIQLINAANADFADLRIRFVRLAAGAPPEEQPDMDLQEISALRSGRYIVRHSNLGPNSDFVYSYVKLRGVDDLDAAIELRESFEPENWFTTVSVIRVLIFLVVTVLTTAIVMWILGLLLVVRPIRKLTTAAQRIGAGDFTGEIVVGGHDELSSLAREINRMNERLNESRQQLERESTARINALDQLRHADRLSTLGTLASGIAHELGTPLTVASGHLTTLTSLRTEGSSEATDGLGRQIEKMIRIVGQLLHYGQHRAPNKKRASLKTVLERVVNMLHPFAQKRQLSLVFQTEEPVAPISADETQMEQVFTNIILNAVQAADDGEILIRLQGDTPPAGKGLSHSRYWCVTVVDKGRGMSAEQIERIFSPFFTTKDPGQGTGMGLSIARDIVHEHHGWIAVDSSVGTGSTFSVFIPSLEDEI
jgi:two-component system, NtrC family, sensor kinase